MNADTRPRKRVLIVDDSPDLRSLLTMGLEKAGYETASAEHGAAARDLLLKDPRFDLLLVDLQMPVMDGLTFLRWLRGEARHPAPVLVFTSTDPDDPELDIRTRAREAGATDLLFKPARLPVVLEKVAGLI